MTSISTLAQSQTQIESLKQLLQQIGTLQTQTATGKKSQTLAGLGPDAIVSEQSRANLNALTNFDTNITKGQTRLNIMSSTVTSVQKQAQTIAQAMEGQLQNGNFDMTALHAIANNALSTIKNLMNQQDGSDYVFGGADTANAPVDDTGALDTYAQTNISKWVNGTITTDQLIDSYQDRTQMTDAVMGYSAALASGNARNVAIKADDDSEIDYTTLANDPTFRNIIAVATMIVNMTDSPPSGTGLNQVSGTPGDPNQPPGATTSAQQQNFYQVFNNLIGTINTASTGLNQLNSKLGYAQATLKSIQDDHKLDENTLQSQISDAEDVDMNEVAVKLSTLQTQLQASYQITASLSKLSLAFILP